MGESGSTVATTKWLWLVVFLIAWPVVFQLTGFAAAIVAVAGVPRIGELALITVVLTAAAWALARFAYSRGAPPTIWVSIALGSLPYALIALFALFGVYEVGDFLGIAASVTLPPLAVYLESRRSHTASFTPGVGGPQGTEQALPAGSASEGE